MRCTCTGTGAHRRSRRCPGCALLVMRSLTFLLLPAATAALRLSATALPVLFRPHSRALTIPMAEKGPGGPAALIGFASDRAAGLAVAGGLGFMAEKVAVRMPISLSPLLYATAFGIAIGNTLRLIDPEMKAMAPTAVGMSFAKRRLLRASKSCTVLRSPSPRSSASACRGCSPTSTASLLRSRSASVSAGRSD